MVHASPANSAALQQPTWDGVHRHGDVSQTVFSLAYQVWQDYCTCEALFVAPDRYPVTDDLVDRTLRRWIGQSLRLGMHRLAEDPQTHGKNNFSLAYAIDELERRKGASHSVDECRALLHEFQARESRFSDMRNQVDAHNRREVADGTGAFPVGGDWEDVSAAMNAMKKMVPLLFDGLEGSLPGGWSGHFTPNPYVADWIIRAAEASNVRDS